MGIIYNMIKALEAEDVTVKVSEEKDKLFGKSDVDKDVDAKDNIAETNVFGNNSSSNASDETKEDDIPDDSISVDEDNVQEDSNSDDNSQFNMSEEDIPEEDNSDNTLKMNLRNNMIKIHAIIKNNISLITNFLSEINDQIKISVLIKVSAIFSDCESLLYKIITEEFSHSSYEILMKKYVAIVKIYDISIEMMNIHFTNKKIPD